MTLPNTLSALLRLAVFDVRACEAEPARFMLDMQTWVTPIEGTKLCRVCMAGAVMVRELPEVSEVLREGAQRTIAPATLAEYRALVAINDMREGQFLWAHLHLSGSARCPSVRAQDASDRARDLVLRDWDAARRRCTSWDTYLQCADLLAAGGL